MANVYFQFYPGLHHAPCITCVHYLCNLFLDQCGMKSLNLKLIFSHEYHMHYLTIRNRNWPFAKQKIGI